MELRSVLRRLRVVLLELGVALRKGGGTVGIAAGVAQAAIPAAAKTGTGAAADKTAIAKARAAAKGASAKAAARETAMKAAKAAAASDRIVGPDRSQGGDRRSRQQSAGQPVASDQLLDHRCPPGAIRAAATVANGIFCVPGGNSGVKTGAAMRGLKSQSLKTAWNCGCDARVL